MADKKATEAMAAVPRFAKAQLMASNKYASRKDLIGALLDDNTEYTIAQVDELIEKYLKGKVI